MVASNSTASYRWLTVLSALSLCGPPAPARRESDLPVRRMASHTHAPSHEIVLTVTNPACSQSPEASVNNITGGINMFVDRTPVRGGTIPAHRGNKQVRFLAMTASHVFYADRLICLDITSLRHTAKLDVLPWSCRLPKLQRLPSLPIPRTLCLHCWTAGAFCFPSFLVCCYAPAQLSILTVAT